jgi:hypothetical protein
MKALDRFTAFMMFAIGIAGIALIINSSPRKTNTTLIPDTIISVTDYYVLDSEYIYLCQKDSIIYKIKKDENNLLYLDGVFPLYPTGSVR